MQFLEWFCEQHKDECAADPLLQAIVPCLTLFVVFYCAFCAQFSVSAVFRVRPPLLNSVQATGTSAMNTVMASLYQEGFYIRAFKAERIAKLWLLYLQKYTLAAHICYSRGLRRFALVPKHHYLHHGCIRLLREAQKALRDSDGWAISPLGESVQMEEDFIGRPSRMSRRVNPKRIHYRVCQRTLISAMIALKQSDKDDRGLFTSHVL